MLLTDRLTPDRPQILLFHEVLKEKPLERHYAEILWLKFVAFNRRRFRLITITITITINHKAAASLKYVSMTQARSIYRPFFIHTQLHNKATRKSKEIKRFDHLANYKLGLFAAGCKLIHNLHIGTQCRYVINAMVTNVRNKIKTAGIAQD